MVSLMFEEDEIFIMVFISPIWRRQVEIDCFCVCEWSVVLINYWEEQNSKAIIFFILSCLCVITSY